MAPKGTESAWVRGSKRASRLTQSLLDVTVDGKLTSSKSTNHEQTSRKTSEGTTETKLTSDLDKPGDGALTGQTLGLVDLGQHSISRLRDNGSSEASEKARSQVNTGLGTTRQLGLVKASEESLGNLFESDKLGHCVGNPVCICQLLFFCVRDSASYRDQRTV